MIKGMEEVGYGRPASAALARAITIAKGGRVLAPVTVVVSSNFVGLSARWLLGSGALGLAGVANVSFVTPLRLAQLLGAGQLSDRRALTNPVLGAAVRRALAADPGPYAAVAGHPATEAALVGLYRELANLDPAARAAVAAHDRGAAASLTLHQAVTTQLAGFHDEAELARAAAARPLLGLVLEPFGHFVWYLPGPLPGPLVHLLSILFGVAPTQVIVGVTGSDAADAAVRRVVRLAGVGPVQQARSPAGRPAAARPARVVSVPDPDDEVRWAVRHLLGLLASGIPADRMAVLYPAPHPYLDLLSEQLAAAGIPANGPARRPLTDSAVGRALLAALALPSQQWRRDRVMALLSGAPLRAGNAPVPVVSWDNHSRDAGVVAGLDDWRRKLSRHQQQIQVDAQAALVDGDVARHDRRQLEATSVAGLVAYIEQLAALVASVRDAAGWAVKSAAAAHLVDTLLGGYGQRSGWPIEEVDAAEELHTALVRLAELDTLEPDPPADTFHQALANELDRTHGRQGRFGEGVLFGPLSVGVGLDLDAVVLLGCVEGLCPGPRRVDSLLSEGARTAAAGELPVADDRRSEQHRAWLAALAAAPPGRTVALVPRGDLRHGRRTLPSRFVVEALSAQAGRLVTVTTFERLGPPLVEVVASHASAMVGVHQHATVGDRDVVELLAARQRGAALHIHPLATLTGTGFLAQHLRAGADFSAYDGNVAGQPLVTAVDRVPLAATRLEAFAQCGFRYLLAHVLGVRQREDPERVVELNPLDRGSALHEVLERFLAENLARGAPSPHQPWSTADGDRLVEIAEAVFEELEQRGRGGRAVSWRLQREALLTQLARFLVQDNAHRARHLARPQRVEMAFGIDGAAPVELSLGNGRSLALRGRADRADLTADGRTLVFDYKTGSAKPYQGLHGDSPDGAFAGGTTLQLGVYAEAARQHFGTDRVEAYYWLLEGTSGTPTLRGYTWNDRLRQHFLGLLQLLVEGIEGGLFPMVPGAWSTHFAGYDNCRHCPFDSICPTARGEVAEIKLADPVLRSRAALHAGVAPAGAERSEDTAAVGVTS